MVEFFQISRDKLFVCVYCVCVCVGACVRACMCACVQNKFVKSVKESGTRTLQIYINTLI